MGYKAMKKIYNSITSLLIVLVCFVNLSFCVTAEGVKEKVFTPSDCIGKSEAFDVSADTAGMKPKDWLSFDISDVDEGRYILKITAKANDEALLNIAANGEVATNLKMMASSEYVDNISYFDINKWTEVSTDGRLKITCAFGSLNVSSIRLEKISGTNEEETSFVSALNEAQDENEIISAFDTYGEKFSLNLSDYADDFWYKKPIYTSFINQDFKSVLQVAEKLSKTLAEEKTQATATLYEDGKEVTSLSGGTHDLKIEIKHHRIKSGTSVLSAIYEDSDGYRKMLGVSGVVDITPSQLENGFSMEINDVEIENPNNISYQLFAFENADNITPYDIYINKTYKEFYVSTKGNDADSGTKEKPFATIGKAKEAASAISDGMTGDIIVNIEPGTYFLDKTETFTAEHSGKNGYNIIYRGTDKENPPVFSGGEKLEVWTPEGNGIYSAPLVADEVRNLYVNGVAAVRARSRCCFKYLEDYDDTTDSTYTLDGFVTSDDLPELAYPEEAETVWQLIWRSHRLPVKSVKKENGKTIMLLERKYWHQSSGLSSEERICAGQNYYVENAMEFLDEPGEFYYDKRKDKIFYYPYAEEILSECEIYAPITENLFNISGESKTNKVSNIVFDNIAIKHGAWNYVSEYGLMTTQASKCIDNVNGGAALMLPNAQFSVDMADNIKILNCEFSSLGSNAISMTDGVANTEVIGNIIKDVSGSGITIGHIRHNNTQITEDMEVCRNIVVENNVLRRVSTEYIECPAITMFYGNSISIKHNDIKGTPYSGISVGWGWDSASERCDYSRNIDVSYNRVEDALKTLSDGGIIYSLGHLYDSRISNNYLVKNNDKAFFGIYLDAGSSYLNVYDNVVLDVYKYYLFIQGGYKAQYNKFFRNYTDKPEVKQSLVQEKEGNTVVSEYEEPTNEIKTATLVDGDNLSEDALSIKENAGLTNEYKHLLNDVETPDYIKHNVGTLPKQVDEGGIIVEAESFVKGSVSNVYTSVLQYLYNDWLEYEVDVPKAGIYELVINGGAKAASDNPPTIAVSTDSGVTYKTMSQFVDTGGYSIYESATVGRIALEEGRNRIRLKNIKGSMHFDYFALRYFGEEYIYDVTSEKPTTIVANDYITESGTEWVDSTKTQNMTRFDYLTYGINVLDSGDYDLTLNLYAPGTCAGYFYVYVDGALQKQLYQKEVNSKELSNLGSISLSSGEHTIKIYCTGGTPWLKSISLETSDP